MVGQGTCHSSALATLKARFGKGRGFLAANVRPGDVKGRVIMEAGFNESSLSQSRELYGSDSIAA